MKSEKLTTKTNKQVLNPQKKKKKKLYTWDFPGGPLAKTLSSQLRGPRFNTWSENEILHATTKSSQAATVGSSQIWVLHELWPSF